MEMHAHNRMKYLKIVDIGKLALLTIGKTIELEVNADHNFIGLCFLASFVVLITATDFVIQDISFLH